MVNPYQKPSDDSDAQLTSWRQWHVGLRLALGFVALSLLLQIGQALYAWLAALRVANVQLVYGAVSLVLTATAVLLAARRQRSAFVAFSLALGCLHIAMTAWFTAQSIAFTARTGYESRALPLNIIVLLVWLGFSLGLIVAARRAAR